MINVPFIEIDRLWLFRDFTLLPFLAIFVVAAMQEMRTTLDRICRNITTSLRRIATHKLSKKLSFFARIHLPRNVSLGSMLTNFFFLAIISGWATVSVYYAYPHWSPLQTSSYELEAVKYIKATTNETYIIVCDSWMTYAGGMIVGIHNPQAYYFSSGDPHGIALFIEMRNNPTNETMKEAMKTNNATTAYFIIEKPRLGTDEYNRVIQKAEQNRLQTYPGGVFYYKDEEKLHIFYYQRES